jgi:elongation factor Ts
VISKEMVKALRERTGAGVLDCKKALEETGGDLEEATRLLRQRGLAIAAKKAGRLAQEGLVEAYIHAGGRLGALVEINCETDFVARTEEFQSLAHDLAMQVVASNPQYLRPEDIPPEVIEEKRRLFLSELEGQNKPEHLLQRIVEGKLERYYDQVCLLRQPFIKDEGLTVGEVITEGIAKLGENMVVRRFVRYELGEGS